VKQAAGRKAPKAKASEFNLNTIKRGSDGRQWIVRKREDGTKSWYRHSGQTKSSDATRVSMPGRKAPPYAASCFPAGTVKRRSNGCLYIVRITGTIPRWNLMTGGPKCGGWLPNKRKAPSESASSLAVGTVALGRNGRKWKVTKNSNGVKTWRQSPRVGAPKRRKKKTMTTDRAAKSIQQAFRSGRI
jgi:hypothetical protein